MTLTPAYGRDYKSKKEVLADFDAGKDFVANDIQSSGSYTNKTDLIAMGFKEVTVRYSGLRKVTVVKLT